MPKVLNTTPGTLNRTICSWMPSGFLRSASS